MNRSRTCTSYGFQRRTTETRFRTVNNEVTGKEFVRNSYPRSNPRHRYVPHSSVRDAVKRFSHALTFVGRQINKLVVASELQWHTKCFFNPMKNLHITSQLSISKMETFESVRHWCEAKVRIAVIREQDIAYLQEYESRFGEATERIIVGSSVRRSSAYGYHTNNAHVRRTIAAVVEEYLAGGPIEEYIQPYQINSFYCGSSRFDCPSPIIEAPIRQTDNFSQAMETGDGDIKTEPGLFADSFEHAEISNEVPSYEVKDEIIDDDEGYDSYAQSPESSYCDAC